MKNAIIRVIADALDEEFWREESEVLKAYYDEGNAEINCDDYNSYIDGEEGVKLEVGNRAFIINVKEQN